MQADATIRTDYEATKPIVKCSKEVEVLPSGLCRVGNLENELLAALQNRVACLPWSEANPTWFLKNTEHVSNHPAETVSKARGKDDPAVSVEVSDLLQHNVRAGGLYQPCRRAPGSHTSVNGNKYGIAHSHLHHARLSNNNSFFPHVTLLVRHWTFVTICGKSSYNSP